MEKRVLVLGRKILSGYQIGVLKETLELQKGKESRIIFDNISPVKVIEQSKENNLKTYDAVLVVDPKVITSKSYPEIQKIFKDVPMKFYVQKGKNTEFVNIDKVEVLEDKKTNKKSILVKLASGTNVVLLQDDRKNNKYRKTK